MNAANMANKNVGSDLRLDLKDLRLAPKDFRLGVRDLHTSLMFSSPALVA